MQKKLEILFTIVIIIILSLGFYKIFTYKNHNNNTNLIVSEKKLKTNKFNFKKNIINEKNSFDKILNNEIKYEIKLGSKISLPLKKIFEIKNDKSNIVEITRNILTNKIDIIAKKIGVTKLTIKIAPTLEETIINIKVINKIKTKILKTNKIKTKNICSKQNNCQIWDLAGWN